MNLWGDVCPNFGSKIKFCKILKSKIPSKNGQVSRDKDPGRGAAGPAKKTQTG